MARVGFGSTAAFARLGLEHMRATTGTLNELALAPGHTLAHMALAGATGAWGVSFLFLALGVTPVVLVAPVTGYTPYSLSSSRTSY